MTASPPPLSLSGPVEDYLKAIYDLELTGTAASTNDIADRLAISPA
jgi:Mn-dependent DtxR family transcriptional regulator